MTTNRYHLYAEFEIYPDNYSCPLCCLERDVSEFRHLLTDDVCQIELIRGPDTCDCPDDDCVEVRNRRTDISESCHCTVFAEYSCIPEVTATDGAMVRVETYLPDQSHLTNLVDDLQQVTEGVELRRLKRTTDGKLTSQRDTVTLEVANITQKQREAVILAVAEGWYSRPRETTLEELAADLGVTTSAVSQRLNAVESKLAVNAFSQAVD